MRKTDTTQVTVKPGEQAPSGLTDWARLDALTDDEALVAAAADPDAPPLSPGELADMRRASPVKALRQKLAMTQAEFAEAFSLPLGTYETGSSVAERSTQHAGRPGPGASARHRLAERAHLRHNGTRG